jgi:fumarate hydratase class II
MKAKVRKERDVLGEVEIPDDAYWGATTQRAIEFFQVSGNRFSTSFIRALAETKKACTSANSELGNVDAKKSRAILAAVDEVILGKLSEQFPLDVFQSGSGTQVNMNMNEVLANRANEILVPFGEKDSNSPQ